MFLLLRQAEIMSQIYTVSLGEAGGKNRKGPDERLSQRVAIMAIAALSVLLWAPILLPFAALLDR
jgi:hypothetical protein